MLGVRIDCVDMARAVSEVERLLDEPGPCRLVATVNPESIMRARRDRGFARALDGAALRVADGWGAAWAARRRGCAVEQAVPGVELAGEVAAICARRRLRLYLLGGAAGVAAAAAASLQSTHPGLEIAGCEPGSPEPADDKRVVDAIVAARPDAILVAYGQPAQELWIQRNAGRIPARVAVGVGGTFDYLAGVVPRAPAWMRSRGLEWLFRLLRQPWRARRMAVLPVYALLVLLSRE